MTSARDVIALYRCNPIDCGGPCPCASCLAYADEEVSALDAAGFAIVPKEPTEKMMEAGMVRSLNGWDSNVWRAMVEASQCHEQ